jgi:hypothetical protein
MKIGIIGLSENVKQILENARKLSFSGYYTSDNIVSNPDIENKLKKYSSSQQLINQSEILYINADPEAFEIAKNAIKASTHILFESPYLFAENDFNDLFELAHENNVLLKFNQKILQKKSYKKTSSKQEPGLIKFRADHPNSKDLNTTQKQLIFDFASIVRDNINSGIRRINVSKDKQSDKYFSLTIQMDNDSGCELLFSRFASEQQSSLELFYPNRLVYIDLMNDKKIHDNHKDTQTKGEAQDYSLMSKELEEFKSSLSKLKSMPITIREENQYLLYFTNRLTEKIFHS